MKCPNCKAPIKAKETECEWCNSIVIEKKLNSNNDDDQLLNKGEGLFYSKRIAKTKCFYELYNTGIKIFDAEENLNLFIKKEIIFNIEPCKRFRFLHFIPILGTIIRFVILIFIKYKRGFSIITSKSGENIIYLKKQNYEKFSKLILQYI